MSYAIIWRLAGKLKKAFSHQSICIVGDALYACRPVMDICRANKWQFILTFKEGRSPKVHEAVQAAKARCGGFSFLERPDDGGGPSAKGIVSWVDARECSYDLGEELDFRAVTYFCWDRIDGRYCGQFATGFEVSDSKRAECIAMWGRRRWNIENGFKVEKNDGFGLEHTFCNDDTAWICRIMTPPAAWG